MSRNGKCNLFFNGRLSVGNKISEKKLIFGRYINDADVSGNKNVVVIGEEIYKNFLIPRKRKSIGKSINIKGFSLM
jgi:putative ABC transport system permease protein